MVRKTDSEIKKKLKDYGFDEAEVLEIKKELYQTTDYPAPRRAYRIEFEAESYNVEEMYYWIVGHLHYDFGMQDLHKIIDTHAHSAGSALFGDLQARLGAQQSNVSNYLGMMGRLVKDLFALVRELRQLEERLGYYTESKELKDAKKANAAESTLKDIWITLVEGGSQNPSSVYGMAQKVGFTILPDLFFSVGPLKKEDVDKHVDSLEFNDAVKNALRRKLFQFTNWKEETHRELQSKRNFQIKYLRQHYEVIQMYMEWIKPYIRNIQRLNLNENRMDNDAFLIHSFDSSVSEIEVALAKGDGEVMVKKDEDGDVVKDENGNEVTDDENMIYSVVLINFTFHTKPQLLVRAPESYNQKGAVHVGHVDMIMRCYGWSAKDIDNYKRYRESEAWDFIQSFDSSIKDAMEYLGKDLKTYLEEAGKRLPQPDKNDGDKKKNDSGSINIFPWGKNKKKNNTKDGKDSKSQGPNPFKETLGFFGGPFHGVVELIDPMLGISNLMAMFGSSKEAEAAQAKKDELKDKKKGAAGAADRVYAYQAFKNYKKAHRMTHW